MVSRATLAAAAASLVAIVALLIGTAVRAETPPPPPPSPSFAFAAAVSAGGPAPGTPLQGPGRPATGSWSILSSPLPDGSYYVHISQVNLLSPSATPCPGTTPEPTPAPTPTPSPTPTPAPVVTPYDDGAFTYFGSGWGIYTGTVVKYGGSDHFTSSSGDSYGFVFTGSAVAIYSQTAPWMGVASFSVDGGVAAEFDAYAASATQQVVVFRSGPLAPAVHRVIVRNTGRLNPAATTLANGGGQLTVDRADITDGTLVPPLAP